MTETKLRNTWANMNKAIVLFIISIVIFNIMFALWNGINEAMHWKSFQLAVTLLITLALSVGLYVWRYPESCLPCV